MAPLDCPTLKTGGR